MEGNNMALEHLNQGNFDTTIQSYDGFTVVDFFATWCGPCKMFTPILETAAQKMPDVHFYKVDIDADMSLAERYRIMTVPTLLIFKGGQLVDQSVGVISEQQLQSILDRH